MIKIAPKDTEIVNVPIHKFQNKIKSQKDFYEFLSRRKFFEDRECSLAKASALSRSLHQERASRLKEGRNFSNSFFSSKTSVKFLWPLIQKFLWRLTTMSSARSILISGTTFQTTMLPTAHSVSSSGRFSKSCTRKRLRKFWNNIVLRRLEFERKRIQISKCWAPLLGSSKSLSLLPVSLFYLAMKGRAINALKASAKDAFIGRKRKKPTQDMAEKFASMPHIFQKGLAISQPFGSCPADK